MISLVKTIEAHSDKVWSVAVHPNLPMFATASTDKTSSIYALNQSFSLVARLEDAHKRLVRSVAFKPPLGGLQDYADLPALASGSFDLTISVWGIEEPEGIDELREVDDDDERAAMQRSLLCSPQNEWNLMAIIEGHENEVKAVAWSHDGRLLASCSRDKTVWLWETDPETLEEFECVAVLNDHQQDVKHIVWHPRLSLLASSSYDDTIRIYAEDDDEWSCVAVLNGHEGTVWCLAFDPSPDRVRLVLVLDDATARVWTACGAPHTAQPSLPSSIRHHHEMAWECLAQLPPVHTQPVYSVSWSPALGRIATVGSDGLLVIYCEDTDGWHIEAQHALSHGVYEVNCVAWASLGDREAVITAGDDGRVKVWSVLH